MSLSLDNPEYDSAPAVFPTDTLVASVVILLGATILQRLVGFVRAVLFCRWLDAEQLGLWDMAFSFLLLAGPVSVLALPGAFGRYIEHYRQRGLLRWFIGHMALACSGLAVLGCMGIFSTRRWVASLLFGSAERVDLVVVAAACLAAVVAYNFLVELFTGLRNVRLASIMQLSNSLAFALLGVVLLLCWQCSAMSVLVAYGLSCLLAAVLACCLAIKFMRSYGDNLLPIGSASSMERPALWRKIAPYAVWVLLGSILINMFEVVDRYMLIHFSRLPAVESLQLVGNYHSSRVVPMLLVSVAFMLGAMITPHLSRDWEAGRREMVALRLRLFIKLFGLAQSAAAVAVLAATPLLFGWAFRGKYPGGESVLPWTLIYCSWFGLALIMQNYLLCAEKARLASAALACGVAINIPLNLILLPRFGLEGAVWATAAANALLLVLICRFNYRWGFNLDDGAKLVLTLPMLLCFGPVIAGTAVLVVAADMLFGNRLLLPEEKRLLLERGLDCARYIGLEKWLARFCQ